MTSEMKVDTDSEASAGEGLSARVRRRVRQTNGAPSFL